MAEAGAPAASTGGKGFRLRGDIIFAVGIICILVALVLPMPAWLLDICLALSFAFSVLILMSVLFIERPLEMSSFPTILLVSTMIRLSLNLASTRLILANGHEGKDAAGHVIEAFGGFIMQDNFVIGVIVFSILTIVNFVVITKGAGRIAEVAARFSLDAMPGKQMAIDADLSAGIIDEKEARTRRTNLEQESTFFGSMDGAAKFVRGDAIAGLLIVFINVIGGIIIGMAQRDLDFSAAADAYIHLTIGDGLITQIPALIVSVASGMLVSKAGVSGTAEKALFAQLSRNPQALVISAVVMAVLALMPGIPAFPFLFMAAIAGFFGYQVIEEKKKVVEEKAAAETAAAQKAPVAEEPISKALAIDMIRVELGYALLPLVNNPEKGKLTDQIKSLRRQLAEDMGFILPSVRIQDNLQLPASTYIIKVKEIEAGKGDIRPDMLLCMNPTGERVDLPGENTREPTFGLPAMWISPDYREEAHFRGYTVVDPSTVVTTHLTEIIKDNISDLLSYAETQKLLDELPKAHQKLIADIIPGKITVTGVQRILQNLISERVSIRDLATVLEGIAEATAFTSSITSITEHVRSRLARQICDQNLSKAGVLPLVTLSPEWEQSFAESLIGQGEDRQLAMAPSRLQQFIQAVRATYEDLAMKGETPVMLTSPQIRPYVRSIIERFRPQTVIMSQNEIHPRTKIKTLSQIS
jgi:flagellar biosynthesis protein FlhA